MIKNSSGEGGKGYGDAIFNKLPVTMATILSNLRCSITAGMQLVGQAGLDGVRALKLAKFGQSLEKKRSALYTAKMVSERFNPRQD